MWCWALFLKYLGKKWYTSQKKVVTLHFNYRFTFNVSKNNMKTITLKDKTFGISIPESELFAAVDKVAEKMSADLAGKNPLFLIVLNGAFMFASDLLKRVEIPAQLSFVKVASYCSTCSTGNVTELIGLNEDVKGRTIVVIEDIVDSGRTMYGMVEKLKSMGADDIRIATLFFKPEALKYDLTIDYVAMEIPNDFIVGYGLDYDGYGRNLRDIYTLVTSD
jgi:hypoxanthine phosphoribosyltransferase